MNINQIKAFFGHDVGARPMGGERYGHRIPHATNQTTGQSSSAGLNSLTMSTSKDIGVQILARSLEQHLRFSSQGSGQTAKGFNAQDVQSQKSSNDSLFDFKEVAKNVLSFVSGALTQAKSKGMDNSHLAGMFEQARAGVAKGIKLARHDLGGLMNGEIDTGIKKSQDLIERGLQGLEKKFFGPDQTAQDQSTQGLQVSQSLSYASQNSSQLTIYTKEGDRVQISFENAEQFRLNQQYAQQYGATQPGGPIPGQINNSPAGGSGADTTTASTGTTGSSQYQLQYQHFQSQQFSFSVKGQLNDQELQAIGQLVGNTADLASNFFSGNIDQAFEQAKKLGYDDQTLTGYTLQLSSSQKSQMTQTYNAVSGLNDNGSAANDKTIKPVADYMRQLMDVMNQAKNLLKDSSNFDGLVNGVLNQMPEVQTPDLIGAINRFHGFNQRVIANLPTSAMLSGTGESTPESEVTTATTPTSSETKANDAVSNSTTQA